MAANQVCLLCASVLQFELRWRSFLDEISDAGSVSGRMFYFHDSGCKIRVLIEPSPRAVCGLRADLLILDGPDATLDSHIYRCLNNGGKMITVDEDSDG